MALLKKRLGHTHKVPRYPFKSVERAARKSIREKKGPRGPRHTRIETQQTAASHILGGTHRGGDALVARLRPRRATPLYILWGEKQPGPCRITHWQRASRGKHVGPQPACKPEEAVREIQDR